MQIADFIIICILSLVSLSSAMQREHTILFADGTTYKLAKKYDVYSKVLKHISLDTAHNETPLELPDFSQKDCEILKEVLDYEYELDQLRKNLKKAPIETKDTLRQTEQVLSKKIENLFCQNPIAILNIADYLIMDSTLDRYTHFSVEHLEKIVDMPLYPTIEHELSGRIKQHDPEITRDIFWEMIQRNISSQTPQTKPPWFHDDTKSDCIHTYDGILSAKLHQNEHRIEVTHNNKTLCSIAVDNDPDIIKINRNGTHLAYTDSLGLYIWNLNTKNHVRTISLPAHILACTFTPDASYIAVGIDNGTIHLIDLQSESRTTMLHYPSQPITLASHPSENILAAGLLNDTIHLVDLASLRTIMRIRHYGNLIKTINFSPEGTHLAYNTYGQDYGYWRLYSQDTKQLLAQELSFKQLCLVSFARKLFQKGEPLCLNEADFSKLHKVFESMPVQIQLALASAYKIKVPYRSAYHIYYLRDLLKHLF